MYATIVYAYHEENLLLHTFKPNLLFYARFIDDIIGIWVEDSSHIFSEFKSCLPFGGFTWKATDLSPDCIFLDLQLNIEPSMNVSSKIIRKL